MRQTDDEADEFAITPEQVAAHAEALRAGKKTKAKRPPANWVKVPEGWPERLKGATGAAYQVALFLLAETWRKGWHGEPCWLRGITAKTLGLPAPTKSRVLRDLAARGLVELENQPGAHIAIKVKLQTGGCKSAIPLCNNATPPLQY
jgi:hypothetical protein